MTIKTIRKALVAIGALIAALVTALADGQLDPSEAVNAVLALLAAAGVYLVPNAEPEPEIVFEDPADEEPFLTQFIG